MQIHITRSGQTFGPYTVDEVNQQLDTGGLNASELAWHEGLETWVPLMTIKGVSVRPPPPPQPPPPPPRSVDPLPAKTVKVIYQNYDMVPWYRRSGTNSIFLVVSLFTGIPLVLSICYMLLTGDIYYNKKDSQGNLKMWSDGNKIVAAILLVINIIYLASWLR